MEAEKQARPLLRHVVQRCWPRSPKHHTVTVQVCRNTRRLPVLTDTNCTYKSDLSKSLAQEIGSSRTLPTCPTLTGKRPTPQLGGWGMQQTSKTRGVRELAAGFGGNEPRRQRCRHVLCSVRPVLPCAALCCPVLPYAVLCCGA